MKRIVVSMCTLLAITFLVACNNDEEVEQTENNIVPVEIVEATEGELVVERSVNGRTSPKNVTPIIIEQSGEVETLEVKNGDKVKKDYLIATLLTPAGKQNIYASEAGEIASLSAKEGEITSSEEPLAVILNLEEVTISLAVTSDVRSLFSVDDKHDVVIDGETYEAEITSISTMPNDTGLYDVEAIMDNENVNILPGMIAVMNVPERRVKEAILLPTEAIVEEVEGTYIFVIKDDVAVKTEVIIKETQSDETAIEGEVNEGDVVVINGQLTLSDGSEVEVVEEGNKS